MKSSGESEAEVAEGLIRVMYHRFEESFVSIAIEKGVARTPEKR